MQHKVNQRFSKISRGSELENYNPVILLNAPTRRRVTRTTELIYLQGSLCRQCEFR